MGAAAGPQTRASRRRLLLQEALLCGIGLFLIAASVLAYAGRDPESPAKKWIALAAVPLPFVALMFGLALWVWRITAHPRRSRNLAVQLDRHEAGRGDTVIATVTVRNDSALRGELQLGLVSVERYDTKVGSTSARMGYYRVTKESPIKEDWRPAGTGSVSFTIPSGTLCSYEGECVSYAWRISARDHRGGRRDPRTDVALWVSP